MNPEQLEREQERDAAALAEAVKIAEGRLAAISPDLRADIIQEKRRAIREEALQQAADRRNRMISRAEQARAALPRYTPEAIRRNARFADDAQADANIRVATLAVLSRTPTPALLGNLEDAIGSDNVAAAECCRLEFQSRNDRSPEIQKRFETTFAKLKLPQAEDAQQALNRTIGLTDIAAMQLAELHARPSCGSHGKIAGSSRRRHATGSVATG